MQEGELRVQGVEQEGGERGQRDRLPIKKILTNTKKIAICIKTRNMLEGNILTYKKRH